MSDPVQIQASDIRVGDAILIKRVENAGEDYEFTSTIQGVVSELYACHIRFQKSPPLYLLDDENTYYLVKRAPTKRAITIDDLKDWQKVPLGTKIEFWSDAAGRAFTGLLFGRYESVGGGGWSFSIGTRILTTADIKPGTLFAIEEFKFIIEDAKP